MYNCVCISILYKDIYSPVTLQLYTGFFLFFLHISDVVYDQNAKYFICPISGNYSVRLEHCKNKKQGKT